jgi:hypothetical protein
VSSLRAQAFPLDAGKVVVVAHPGKVDHRLAEIGKRLDEGVRHGRAARRNS